MAEKKGRKSNHVKHDNSIEAVFDILSKVSKSKYSNQSDIKILRNIKLTELANRLSSCLTGLREYGEISNREESLHHQLQCLDKAISKNINLMEWPIKDHWFEGIPFTEVSANELENPRLINIMEDIHNQLSINACLENCLTLSFFNENSQIEMTDEEKRKYNILEYLITGKHGRLLATGRPNWKR